ncbi:uncharacterized protein LOC133778942 [Humulus lupulus]|uniref:uncharacterized protein LOC133778942 n=1 Tax=Humulus lupulus TaxID=3486 RepID=UPI002B4006CB|nr:uncharacterized protein LOC133778942 [Humulus lupulus]
MCAQVGVKWDPSEPLLQPMHILNRSSITRFKVTNTARESSSSQTQARPPPSTKNMTLADHMTLVEESPYTTSQELHAHRIEFQAHQQRMIECASYQDVYFKMNAIHLGMDMANYPPAPHWIQPYPPPIPMMYDDENEEEAEDDQADMADE